MSFMLYAARRRFVRLLAPLTLALTLTLLVSAPASGQDSTAASSRLRVFLDCPTGGCDRNFLVTELPFALFTLDRLDADVHVLVTGLGTGAGGTEYTIGFLGRGTFAARGDTLTAFIAPNSSEDMRRRELARVLQLGLIPFAMRTSEAARFSLRYAVPEGDQPSVSSSVNDPWNFWVYRARVNGSANAESRSSSYQVNPSIDVSRVTERWKYTFHAQSEYRANSFELSDGSERTFILRSVDANSRLVKSLSDHWSMGTRVSGGLSEFRNQDAYGAGDVSAEYNVFPWREATSRQLIALVAVGARHYDYAEETVFGRFSETRPIARAIVAGESRLAWGTLDGSLRYFRFLHNNEAYNLSFNGRATFRISRGLSLELRGEAAKVNDQLYLPRGDATDDEVLTRQRALATSYRYGGSVGLSFTFGSIYNTIVNPRLDELGG
jgi:hypothetical protein